MRTLKIGQGWLIVLFFFTIQLAHAGEQIIRFETSAAYNEMKAILGNKNIINDIPQLNAFVFDERFLTQITSNKFRANRIRYIQKNRQIKLLLPAAAETDKAVILGNWGSEYIGVKTAWKRTYGRGVVVAVSDTGIASSHPDFKGRMWLNPGESGLDSNGKKKTSNKIDDDGNGYKDDAYGWDFGVGMSSTRDNLYHGTHVAGTIAASLKSLTPGIAPEATLMSSAFLDDTGSGTEAHGAQTIIYATDNGAKIVNCSWGAYGDSALILDAIKYAGNKGVLVVGASGNDAINTDTKPHIPSAYNNLDNVISVAAIQSKSGEPAWFSNFGFLTVDMAAPGHLIKSTFNPYYGASRLYDTLSGTSMAAPHVSGVAALIISLKPRLSPKQVKDIILSSVQKTADWTGITVSGGMLRADTAVEQAAALP